MSQANDRSALEARLQAAQAELARVREEFATFSGRLSHDLHAVLRNIGGFAEALQDQQDGTLTQRQARYVERIRAGAQRGDGILRDLVALSAATVARMEPAAVDMESLVDDAIRELAPACAGRQVQWERAGTPWPRLHADPALLRMVVDQLLGNAVKFTRGREPAHIRVQVTADANGGALVVTDNGVGFDPAYQSRLFGAFERLHDAAEFEGNGIGLALVRTVVQRHQGQVRAQALPDGGALFGVSLPHGPEGARPAATPAPPPPPSNETAHYARKLRVLLVDDEALVRVTVQMMLQREGHAVTTAPDGATALQLLAAGASGAIDLVLCDWSMPGIGGGEVVRAAKRTQPGIRAIVMTGKRPDAQGKHAMPADVDQVLDKPVSLARLREAMKGAMGEAGRG